MQLCGFCGREHRPERLAPAHSFAPGTWRKIEYAVCLTCLNAYSKGVRYAEDQASLDRACGAATDDAGLELEDID